MGTYLSTPVKDKTEEWGESLHCPSIPLAWGVVDMQGWRKSMEDSHVAQTDVDMPALPAPNNDNNNSSGGIGTSSSTMDAKVFGVFDGHGGPEVARFASQYLVSVLTQQPTWKAATVSSSPLDSSTHSQPDENSNGARAAKNTSVGRALQTSFHALDRMINDPNRRDELIRLRAIKPPMGTQKDAVYIPPEPLGPEPSATSSSEQTPAVVTPPPPPPPPEQETSLNGLGETQVTPATHDDGNDSNDHHMENSSTSTSEEVTTPTATATTDSSTTSSSEQQTQQPQQEDNGNEAMDINDCDSDDSEQAVGKEEAAALDQDLMVSDSEEEEQQSKTEEDILVGDGSGVVGSGKVSGMFQRLLNMNVAGASAGQAVLSLGAVAAATGLADAAGSSSSSSGSATSSLAANNINFTASSSATAEQPFRASLVQNGRMICNLPDHPIHAGATAIVAVIVDRTLTVANAGDSRAVLCRAGGATLPLSFDHKPMQDRELSRITTAGGFVNTFGRVNGNLNLSRSLGDLKYKQVPGVAAADQIITAEPDILQIELDPATDEFIILGCDGIWDCLTNEKAVEYVRTRINDRPLIEIGAEMLDEIISVDPRVTQGIGGDNMTVMIIDLQPHTRSYRKASGADEASPVED